MLKHRDNWQKMAEKKEFIQSLRHFGHFQHIVHLSACYQQFIEQERWQELDKQLETELLPQHILHDFFSLFGVIEKTEHIIAVRSELEDEDGIWHDDGSRDLAFTLSFNKDPKMIQGGEFLLRKKGELEPIVLAPPPWGVLTVILTGKMGFEHRVLKVKKGRRIVCAGWINYKAGTFNLVCD